MPTTEQPAPLPSTHPLSPDFRAPTEKLALRSVKGTKEELIAAITAVPGIAAEDVAWFTAKISRLEGRAFCLDAHFHSANAGELYGHLHLSKIY